MKYKLRKVIDHGPTEYFIFRKLYLNGFVPTGARIAYYTVEPYSIRFSKYKIGTRDTIINVNVSSSHNLKELIYLFFKGTYILFVDRQLTEEDLWTILSETKNKHVIDIITTLLQNV